DRSFRERVTANPRPALRWLLGAIVLVALEFGAVIGIVLQLLLTVARLFPTNPGVAALASAKEAAASIPTLLSRSLIPNRGFQPGGSGEWVNTFLGLEPKYAWLIRLVLVYAYAFIWLGWFWVGYQTFREHYRYADRSEERRVGKECRCRWAAGD